MNKFEEFKAKGNNCFKQGQYNEAVECYKEAIKQDPTNPVGYSNCAMALIKLDNFDSASQMCKRGLVFRIVTMMVRLLLVVECCIY